MKRYSEIILLMFSCTSVLYGYLLNLLYPEPCKKTLNTLLKVVLYLWFFFYDIPIHELPNIFQFSIKKENHWLFFTHYTYLTRHIHIYNMYIIHILYIFTNMKHFWNIPSTLKYAFIISKINVLVFVFQDQKQVDISYSSQVHTYLHTKRMQKSCRPFCIIHVYDVGNIFR